MNILIDVFTRRSNAVAAAQEVVEVVIAGAGLSGDVVDAIVAAGEPQPTDPDTPGQPAAIDEPTTTTQLLAAAETPAQDTLTTDDPGSDPPTTTAILVRSPASH